MTEARPGRSARVLPSLLPSWLRRLLRVALVLAAFMLANASYLLVNRFADLIGWSFFAVGATSLPRFFQSMVLTHTGVGLVLVLLLVVFVASHLPTVWKRRHRASLVSGAALLVVALTLASSGLFILTDAASRDNRWAWWLHIVCAAIIPAGYVAHRMVSYARMRTGLLRPFGGAVLLGLAVLVLVHGITIRSARQQGEVRMVAGGDSLGGPGSKDRQIDGSGAFVPAGFVPPSSPFFPSPATSTTGSYLSAAVITRDEPSDGDAAALEARRFGHVREVQIGAITCARCHQDIVAQWATSAHRYASFNNPFYEATVNLLRRESVQANPWILEHIAAFPEVSGRVGEVKSKWCSGCHDPALMLPGRMPLDIDRESVEAQAGLTCMACHAIDLVHNQTGNGNYNIADEHGDPYIFADAMSGTLGAFLHDAALKAKPTVHKRQMLKPFFRESVYCATCHKVSLSDPVNNYRWLRGQNEYDNWDDSGISLNAARTFYLPPGKRTCQDCHMPLEAAERGDLAAKDGKVRSHRFLAVNTALPFIRGDRETIERIEAFLQDEKVTVDIFALSSRLRDAPVMALDRAQPALVVGDRVTVDVVVRNKGVGHTFPGGTNDSNEGWLELTVRDGRGTVVAVSGAVGDDLHLDPMAHVYKMVLVDAAGRPINKRNAQDARATVFASVIGPGTADVAHYEFMVPPALSGDTLSIEVRLLWRKFDRAYTEFAFAANPDGFAAFTEPPALPITEIAADRVQLPVVATAGTGYRGSTDHDNPADWVRFNDYGIGLLLEGNTRAAALAFGRVFELQPDKIDGPLNLARTAIQDGNVRRAYEFLRECERIEPGHAQVAWVWGVVHQEAGRYDDAIGAYQRVLEDFPADRATWRNLGRTYYLNQQYGESVDAFARVLEIDPEDRVAHYHRMLSYRALGLSEEADRSAAAYAYYAIDESAQGLTRDIRLREPGINLMSQPIRTHVLTLKAGRRGM